ncbi:hypothetical protein HDU67_002438 [Dinochytrium kinnereticum]|nr:hypothetical protein HDU67_002438 [Dinochytrium kinnereticum]
MDVDYNLPEVPFIPGGLRSLLTIPVASDPGAEKWNAAIDLLELYFCNKEIKSILAQARLYTPPGTHDAFGAWVSGWVPLGLISSFKAAKALKASATDFMEIIQHLCPSAFEFSMDGTCIRRMVAFDQPTTQERLESMTRPASSGLVVEVTGFEAGVTMTEIKDLFEVCGRVQHVSLGLGGESGTEPAAFIDFESPTGMVKALAGKHVYEDSSLCLRARPKTLAAIATPVNPTATGSTLPSLYSIKATSTPIKSRGNASIQPSAILGYPLNRILKVGPICEDLRVKPALAKSIEEVVSRYGPVVEIIYSEGSLEGHIRFKTSISREVEGFLRLSGGIEVLGDIIPVKALIGEEERIFHEVLKAKTPPAAIDVIPLQPMQTAASISRKRQKERQAAAVSRRSRRFKKNLTKAKQSKTVITHRDEVDVSMDVPVVNDNNKRPAQPDAMDDLCNAMNLRSGRKIASAKKVKVEHVDNMFKNLTASI